MSSGKESSSLVDGINNPQGLFYAGSLVGYFLSLPLTSMIAAEGGAFQRNAALLAQSIPGLGDIPSDRIIPAVSALYLFVTFVASGVASVAALAAASDTGLDLQHPRKQPSDLRGLPLRLRSAHANLMEVFPAFALVAALTQSLAPTNQVLINLLGLHVAIKSFVYWPVYAFNIAMPRTVSHIVTVSAVLNVAWRLALGAA